MRSFLVISLAALGLLAACADFPDLDSAISQRGRNSPYPSLIQIDGIHRPGASELERIETIAKTMVARANGLRQRASALRGPIIDAQTRRKMAAALARHPIAETG